MNATHRGMTLCASLLAIAFLLSICGPANAFAFQTASSPKSALVTDSDLVPEAMQQFVNLHCVDCHDGPGGEGGFDLNSISEQVSANNLDAWVRVVDRVHEGEMPPPDADILDAQTIATFVEQSESHLREFQQRRNDKLGRVGARRLTHLQLENTLHALLGIDIPLARQMPDEPRTDGFTTVATGQSLSHFQLQTHLNVVDDALDEAFRRATERSDLWERTFEAEQIVRRNPRRRCREPEMRNGQAVVWAGLVIYYGRLPVTTAREAGWYRFQVQASAIKKPEDRGVWCTVRSGMCVSSAPLLEWVGAFEAADEPQVWTFETWLPRGHMLEIRPGDTTLKMGRFQGGQIGTGEGEPQEIPGVAIDWLSMERIHHGADNGQVQKLLFDDLQVKFKNPRRRNQPYLESDNPKADLARLMTSFASRAFRRPVDVAEIAHYIEAAQQGLDDGVSLMEAVRFGYRALLCSPYFMYLQEEPGQLSPHAIANRLSYFLTAGPPDEELRRLADSGQLRRPAIIKSQTDRLLAGTGTRKFVEHFADQWLDLSRIEETQPDRRLYRNFDLIVQESMVEETKTFLTDMFQNDRPVSRLVDSEDTFLNSHLARYYNIAGVEGDSIRNVKLNDATPRGGLLTQGAILKVTANGTTTSPVVRGVWISERILGREIPPPPQNVPAIEPDIRGAKSIREMLEKHRSEASCAACHLKIDPPGFALENFDAAGRWRTHYPQVKGRRVLKGAEIDASYDFPDGRNFANIEQFQLMTLRQPEELAANLARQLVTYGTGAPITIADRPEIEAIVHQAESQDFGLKSILKHVVVSDLFLKK